MAVEFENSEELFSTQIGNIGLTAAAFDYFGLAEVIELCAGKTGAHVKVKQSEVVKLMCCLVLNVPYQSLYGTEEFYQEKPIQGLTGNSTISSHDLNRDVLSRALDAIAEYGPERLFLKCAKAVSSKLGLKPDKVHLDSTSFHYEGITRAEEGCNLVLAPGYSRDSHPELNQINELSRQPLFATCVSGHTSDKTSFRNIIIDYWKRIPKESFQNWYKSQSRYRTKEDREKDALLEDATITMPEMAQLLGTTRSAVYTILDNPKYSHFFEFIVIAEKKRITKESFQKFLEGQDRYKLDPSNDYEELAQEQNIALANFRRKKLSQTGIRGSNGNIKYLTFDEASYLAKVSRSMINKWADKGKFTVIKVGSRVRIRRDEFEDWMEQRDLERSMQ